MTPFHIGVISSGIVLILLIIVAIYCSVARNKRREVPASRRPAVERWSVASPLADSGHDQFTTLKRHAQPRPITIRPRQQQHPLQEPPEEDQDGYIDVADDGMAGAGDNGFVITSAVLLRDTATRGDGEA